MIAGVLLTGGASRRLGTDKATARIGGTTLARRAAAALRARCPMAVEVGPGYTDLPSVREEPARAGPLAALAAGTAFLARATEADPNDDLDAVVLVACDLPNVGPALDALVAAPPAPLVVPVDAEGRRQLACARYGTDLLASAAELLDAGERSLRALVALASADAVIELRDLPPSALADVDTPEDAARWGVDTSR
jgi:molybdopterin-guanine dinucleotide biosynthesis protein A